MNSFEIKLNYFFTNICYNILKMDFNKGLMINDVSELVEGNDYELYISEIFAQFNGIYTCKEILTFGVYIFESSVYETKIGEISHGFICMYVTNIITNKTYYYLNECSIFKIPTNEYILK